MPDRILHLVDASTPPEAIESLAMLHAGSDSDTQHFLVALGHRSTGTLFKSAGLPINPSEAIHWISSRGWADPTGWRSLRRLIHQLEPTHLHAWGIAAGVASAMCDTAASRIITLAELPPSASRGVLRVVERGAFRKETSPPRWVVAASWIGRELQSRGVGADRMVHIPPGVPQTARRFNRETIRKDLGILPEDGPVLLMGAEGGTAHSRHDYGLWVGGILQQIFPHVRVIMREDLRGRTNHGLERLLDDLPDGEVPIVASAQYSWEQLLAATDVFLLAAEASLAAESMLHAMAAGVPVVGTPIAAVREWIENGRNGLIAKELKPRAITAEVEVLLADAGLRGRVTAAAREDVRVRFAPATMLDAYQRLYAECRISEPRKAQPV